VQRAFSNDYQAKKHVTRSRLTTRSVKQIVTRAQEIPAKIALEDLAGIRDDINREAGRNQRRR